MSALGAAALFAGCSDFGSSVRIAPAGRAIDSQARSSYRVLYSFAGAGSDGFKPQAGLIDLNGTLYGTTTFGGLNNHGTVFSVSMTGGEHVLHSFAGGVNDGGYPYASLTNVGGKLYGTTYADGANGRGTVFSVSTSGRERIVRSFVKGAYPTASLIDVKDRLDGSTTEGGAYGQT